MIHFLLVFVFGWGQRDSGTLASYFRDDMHIREKVKSFPWNHWRILENLPIPTVACSISQVCTGPQVVRGHLKLKWQDQIYACILCIIIIIMTMLHRILVQSWPIQQKEREMAILKPWWQIHKHFDTKLCLISFSNFRSGHGK